MPRKRSSRLAAKSGPSKIAKVESDEIIDCTLSYIRNSTHEALQSSNSGDREINISSEETRTAVYDDARMSAPVEPLPSISKNNKLVFAAIRHKTAVANPFSVYMHVTDTTDDGPQVIDVQDELPVIEVSQNEDERAIGWQPSTSNAQPGTSKAQPSTSKAVENRPSLQVIDVQDELPVIEVSQKEDKRATGCQPKAQPSTSKAQPSTSKAQPSTSNAQPGTSNAQPGTSIAVKSRQSVEEAVRTYINNNSEVACFIVGKTRDTILERKSLFCAASNVFEAMFNGPMKETCAIEIDDVDSSAFKTMIEFLEEGNARFTNTHHASCVLYVAEKYDVPVLKAECIDYLAPDSVDDMWLALETGVHYNIEQLIEGSLNIVRKNTRKVFISRQFLYLTQEALQVIMEDNFLSVDSEEEVLEAAVAWARFQCIEKGSSVDPEAMRNVLGNIVLTFRFLTMKNTQVRKWASLILPSEELNELLEIVNNGQVRNQNMFSMCRLNRKKPISITDIPEGPLISAIYNPLPADTHFSKLRTSTTTFSISQAIRLISVIVSGRVKTFSYRQSFYCEDITVDVRNCQNELIGVGNFKGKVEYDQKVEVFIYDVGCTKKRPLWLRAPTNCCRRNTADHNGALGETPFALGETPFAPLGYNYNVSVTFNKNDDGHYPCHKLKFSHDAVSCFDVSKPVIIGLTYSKM